MSDTVQGVPVPVPPERERKQERRECKACRRSEDGFCDFHYIQEVNSPEFKAFIQQARRRDGKG